MISKRSFPIDPSNRQLVSDYIRQQFDQRSWWPAEGPAQAKDEFERMQSSAETLTDWCDKWLDGGQWRQLKAAVHHPKAKVHS